MADLQPPAFMALANAYLDNKDIDLTAVVACFQKLKRDDKRLYFGQLCLRNRSVSVRLIDLLFTLAATLPSRRPVTMLLLDSHWKQKRGEKGLGESMLTALAEQHAP